jgi:hypothetical protein
MKGEKRNEKGKANSEIADANYLILTLFADEREARLRLTIDLFLVEYASSIQFMFNRKRISRFINISNLPDSRFLLFTAPRILKPITSTRATQKQFLILLIPFCHAETLFFRQSISLLLRIPFSLMQFSQPHSALHSEHKYG